MEGEIEAEALQASIAFFKVERANARRAQPVHRAASPTVANAMGIMGDDDARCNR